MSSQSTAFLGYGYIINKYEFEKALDEEIKNSSEKNVAYVEIEALPTYQLVLASDDLETNEEEIYNQISQDALITYKVYTIAVNGVNTAYVNSILSTLFPSFPFTSAFSIAFE